MSNSIRLLILEDSQSDAELLKQHLGKAGLNISSKRVENGKSFTAALIKQEWDIILSDLDLPGFDAFAALAILKETGKDIPMIIVSGTNNEEKAIELLRLGAADYMMKNHLVRLAPAVKREFEEAQLRRNHRESEEDLMNSQALYKVLFDQSPFGVLIVDSGTTLPVEFNDIAHRQLGFSREEFYNTPITAFETLESPADVRARIDRLYKTGRDEFDTLQRTKQGEIRNVHVILRLLDIKGKKLQHCIFQDITEKIKAESALRESETAFGDIFQTVKDGIAYTTFTGEVITVNQALMDILEIPREEIIGRNILKLALKLLTGKTLEPVLSILADLLKGREIAPFEVEYKNKILEVSTLINRQSQHLTGVIRDITEQKLSEKKIQKNEALLSAMVSNITDVIAILDMDGIIKYKSPNIEQYFGWKPEDLIGKSGFSTVHPDDLPRVQKNFESLLKAEDQPLSMEYRNQCKDGSYRLITLTATNLQNNPDIKGILLNYHDISEQRELQQTIAKAEERFRKAFVTSPDSININRLQDGLYIEINEGFTAMTGYTNADVTGKTSTELNIWVNVEDRQRLVKGLRENGKVVNLQAQFRAKDGTQKTGLMSANIIEINGETCILSVTRDISELEKADESIKLQSAALNSVANAVTITDAENKIFWANPAFFEMTGYSQEESIGNQLSELLRSGLHDQEFYDNLSATIKNGFVWHGEITNRRKNGELFQEEMTVTPLIAKDGKITNFISVKQDISEKKLNADIMSSRVHLLEYAVSHNLEELLKETLKEVENLTGSLIGFYHFLENDEKTISLNAWSTRTLEEFCSADVNEAHYPVEQAGVWVDCVRERKPVIHNGYASLSNRKELPAGHAALIRELVVPVFRENKIVAVLGVGNKPGDYTKVDIEIVARLADLAWDVAEKKISETALQESENHYREIVTDLDKAQSFAHLGSWTWNIEDGHLTWSDEMFRIFGLDRVSFSGRLDEVINHSIHPEDRQKVEESNRSVSQDGRPIPIEYRIIRPDNSIRFVWAEAGELTLDSKGTPIRLAGIVQDITERKIIEERVEAERELLHLCNQAENIKDLGKSITEYLKNLTGCDAVGMRLHQGDDYTYFETIGFPTKFIEKERFLCAFNPDGSILLDSSGNPVLECMCGNILQGRINLEKPFFTPNGSFWSNSTTEMLAISTDSDRQARTRNRCNGEGYESVALIPIRNNSRTFGLFQFNDKRKGHFTPNQIETLEHLANFVAIALAKLESDAALAESEKRYKDLFEHAAVPNLLEDFSGAARIFSEIRRQGVTNLRAHFENHPELVDECAKRINVIDANQACVDFFEVSSKEVLFSNFTHFFTESTWPIFQEEIIVLAEGADHFEGDLSAKTSSGEERLINLQLSVDPAYSHNLSRVMVSFIDVTERKRAEKALEKRVLALTQPLENGGTFAFEDLFNLEDIQKIQDEFANATGVASLILKPDGTAITRPSNFCRLCNDIIRKTSIGGANCIRSDAHIGGINTDGPIIQPCLSGGLWDAGAAIMVGGQHVASWLVGQVRDETQTEENMKKYAREIGVDETEFINAFNEVTPMSRERFAQIAEALFTFANQLSTMAYQNAQQARFISDRNRAESALKNTEIHFQSLIENAPDGIALIDQNGRFKYVSPSGRKNFGYEIGDVASISPDDVTHPDDLPAVMDILNRVMQDPKEKLRLEYRFQHKNGSYLWIESTFTNLFHVPSVEAIVINFRDITQRREAEIKIQDHLDELRRWHENTLGRELRVIELKDEVNQALKQAGKPPRYAGNSQMEQNHVE